ncbi:hypothetical protein PHYSODRAFT_462799, partial [Phytophthora sojae]
VVEHVRDGDALCEAPATIIKLGHDLLVKYEVQPLLLRRAEHERVKALEKDLVKFEGVTKELQRSTLTLSTVHRLF